MQKNNWERQQPPAGADYSPITRANRDWFVPWLDKEFNPEEDIPQLAECLQGYGNVVIGHTGYEEQEAYPYLSRAVEGDLDHQQKLAARLAKLLEKISLGVKIKTIQGKEYPTEEENNYLFNALLLTKTLLEHSKDLRIVIKTFNPARLEGRTYKAIHLDNLLPNLLKICQNLDLVK